MEKQYILFDLDGTLTDPMLGITKAVQYALKRFNIEVEDLETLIPFIGPPLKQSFMDIYGFSQEDALKAVEISREYFVPIGMYENQIYPGVREMLENLKEAGRTLLIATSKPVDFAEKILEHFGIEEYFEYVSGSSLNQERTTKEEVIAHLLEEEQLVDMTELIMAGDRKYDILGAKEFGIKSIGVLYGYGSYGELKKAGADYIVKSVSELEDLLLRED